MIGSDPYIVLDASGNGVRGVITEPGAAGLAVAALGLLAQRRRAR
jgi:MYXO-CTERM domain-containing protein